MQYLILGLTIAIVIVTVVWLRRYIASGTSFAALTGGIQNAVIAYLKSNWQYLLLPPLAVVVSLFAFRSLYPVWWDSYVKWDGPIVWLPVAALVIGIIFTMHFTNAWKAGLSAIVLLFIGSAFVWTLLVKAPVFTEPPCGIDRACQDRKNVATAEAQAKKLEEERRYAPRQASVPASTPDCPNRTEALQVGNQWLPISPSGGCIIGIVQNENGCMYFLRAERTQDRRVYGACKGVANKLPIPEDQKRQPDDVKFVASAGGVLTGSYQLRPNPVTTPGSMLASRRIGFDANVGVGVGVNWR